ncbi:MAG: DUF4397 domain-containing protein [Deltaproteobacteria bacterium]|nr:DUF4397 domain-containing protein [Nannocystaceae bacterium]
MNKLSLSLSLLPLLMPLACGDDDDADTGADTSVDTSGSESGSTAGPTTNEPTTEEPTTAGPTTDEPTTNDPESSGSDSGSSGEPTDGARVRVMHLGVGAPAVDVFANGEGPVFEALEFRNSTAYADVPAADYTFEVSVSGMPASEAVLAPELTLDANMSYTAVAIGDIAETDGAPGLAAIALVDNAEGIDPANVRITVIHAAPAVGQVDVWEITAKPVPLVENVDYSGSATLADIPAGPLEIGIDVDDDAEPDVTFSVDATGLAGGQVNVYANNDADGNVALVAQLQDGTVLTIPAN